ncbi:FecR family protein [Methylomonas sp. AM2-LC]|uniref:FecR family protein n=1 Tax=Methylomonas sp. AM2-LC TaxID=3153301 RepID=UPI003263D279
MSKASVSEITELSDQAIDWIIRLNSDKVTKQDKLLAAQWINRSPSHQKAFIEAEQLMLDMGEVMGTEKPISSEPQPLIDSKRVRHDGRRLRGLAVASILFILTLPLISLNDHWFSDYYTAVGEQKTITLADGSQVKLNTDTALSVNYSASGRKLVLKHGQAVFHVATDRNRPFEVATDIAIIKALGTVFEVTERSKTTFITVQEHAVSVKGLHDKDYAETSRVNAGQQGFYDQENGLQSIVAVDINQATAWQRGKLVFKNQPLQEVVAELDRYVYGRIAIVDDRLANLRVSGVFPINDPAASMYMIEQILPIKVTRITPWLTLLHG